MNFLSFTLVTVAFLASGCTAKYKGAAAKAVDPKTVTDSRLAFSIDCRNESATAAVKTTVAAIKDVLKTTTCDAADSALTQQTRFLDLSNRNLTSLASLRGLPHVEEVRLDGNPVTDLEPLSSMPMLQAASLTGVQNKTGLSNVLHLKRLYLDNAGLTDLTMLRSMCGALELLSIRENQITTLEPLRNCTTLKTLYLDGNNVSSLEPISQLPLRVLSADRNRIDNVAPLAAMAQLQLLSLLHDPINNLSPLAGLSAIQVIYLPPATRDEDNCPTATSVVDAPLRDFCLASRNGG